MSRRVAFTQADVSRALKGAVIAGMAIRQVEIDREGKIVTRFAADGENPAAANGNEWDEVLKK